MIQPQDFLVRIDYDEIGVVVVVTHEPTGLQRKERPTSTTSVQYIKDKILAQVEAELYNPAEFEFLIGRCVIDGKIGSFHTVTHKPTGKTRTRCNIEEQPSKVVRRDLLDEIVTELWQEKAS